MAFGIHKSTCKNSNIQNFKTNPLYFELLAFTCVEKKPDKVTHNKKITTLQTKLRATFAITLHCLMAGSPEVTLICVSANQISLDNSCQWDGLAF